MAETEGLVLTAWQIYTVGHKISLVFLSQSFLVSVRHVLGCPALPLLRVDDVDLLYQGERGGGGGGPKLSLLLI